MFNLTNNFSNFVDIIERIRLLSCFEFFYSKVLNHKFALLFLYNKKGEKFFAQIKRVFLSTYPFPNGIFASFILRNASIYSLLNKMNSFSMGIKNSYPGIKNLIARSSFIFINTKVPISIQKSCEPFIKRIIRNYRGREIKMAFGERQRNFKISQLMGDLFSGLFSHFSGEFQIIFNSLKLRSFYNSKRKDMFNKIKHFFGIGHYRPFPASFFVIPFMFINLSSQERLQGFDDWGMSNFNSNSKMSCRNKGNISLSIEEPSKISHKYSQMFCKVPFYKTKQLPATTKFDGLRISSSVCHSLICMETCRGRSEEVSPPHKWSVGVETESNRMPNQQSTLDAEWGTVANIRFLLSSIGSTTANASLLGATVYNIFVCGREAFAAIEQDGYSSQFIYRPPIYDGPLALNASVGYKFAEVPRILNDQWVFNLRCTLA